MYRILIPFLMAGTFSLVISMRAYPFSLIGTFTLLSSLRAYPVFFVGTLALLSSFRAYSHTLSVLRGLVFLILACYYKDRNTRKIAERSFP